MRIDRDMLRVVARLRLTTPQVATGARQGDRRSRTRGRGVEFADYRPYQPGDDLRLVDWNVYGRLQTVLVRLFHEDRNLSVHVAVDASGSMGFGERRKLDHAGDLAAALALMALTARDTISVGAVGGADGDRLLRGPNLATVIRTLESVEAGKACDARRALRAQLGRRGRVDRMFLITDLLLDDLPRESLLRELAGSAHRPVLLHVLGKEDLEPDLSQPTRVVDAETGEELDVAGGPLAIDGN